MTITIDIAPDIAERLRADAERQGIGEADLLRALIERTYQNGHQARRLMDFAGFAAHLRQDDRLPGDSIRQMRDAEWAHRP